MYKDEIDPNSVQIVNAFADMAQWPITKGITSIELVPGRGFVVHVTDTKGWPDYHLDNDPAAGFCRFTLCAGFKIQGRWVMSGFLNYWAHNDVRTDSGAHPLEMATEGGRKGTNNWQANWAYGGWGELDQVVPYFGQEIALFVAAGGTRQSKTLTVRERSQIVTLNLGPSVPIRYFQDITPFPEQETPVTPEPAPSDLAALVATTRDEVILMKLAEAEERQKNEQRHQDIMALLAHLGTPAVDLTQYKVTGRTVLGNITLDIVKK